MKKKDFIDSFDRASIVDAVIKQFGGWENFKESAVDVSYHGAGCGFPGFTYYSDTVKFYKDNRMQINLLACDLAEQIGENVISLISGFNYLDVTDEEIQQFLFMADMDDDVYTCIANALAWLALEEVCHHYARVIEEAA